jgi:uncharacterized protein (TIGR02271 family)
MQRSDQVSVIGKDGWRGRMDPRPIEYNGAPHLMVHLDTGERVLVPTDLLQSDQERGYYIPVTLGELLRDPAPSQNGTEELVIPVAAEELDVKKRRWDTGGVRVHLAVREREETVDEPLIRQEVQVERVPINRPVERPPAPRQEGNVTIIPVVEEVLVVEKRLMLKEEVRITRRKFEAHEPQKVILRSEEPQIEPIQPQPNAEKRAA